MAQGGLSILQYFRVSISHLGARKVGVGGQNKSGPAPVRHFRAGGPAPVQLHYYRGRAGRYFDEDDEDDDDDVVVNVEGQNEGQSVLCESERILKVLCQYL